MIFKKILFTAMLAVISQTLMAQGVRVSGTLTDNDGPIMMANVVERDANNRIVSAVQTDFNGNFSMQVKSTKNKLVFSYVGDKTQIVTIGNKTVFNIKLEPEGTQLQEVVVKAKRGNSGGLMISKKEISVSQQALNMENIEGLAFTSADEALQGEIAGLDIVANSGNLGAGTSMRLRGVTSITGDANPLIVVDDKIFDNPDENFDFANANEEQYASLLSVNVDDIASITVLKDAAATAVWGSKGSNGVLLITTKHGSRGKPHLNFSYKFTGTWQPKGYTLLNGDDYTMLMKEEFYNPAQASDATSRISELNYLGADRWSEAPNWDNNTDWVKEVTQFGAMHDYNVNLSGGGEKATFRISAGYKHQTGSIIKQKFQQLTTRLVLDYNVSDRIRFSTNFALTYTGNNKNYGNNILGIAQKMAPNMSIYRQNADGTDTDEYYIMNRNQSGKYPSDGNYSSYELRDIKKALLFVGDTAGKSVYPEDRSSAMLFGEAGAVMLLEKTEDASDEINALVRSDGSGYRYMIIPGGGYRNLHASEDVVMCEDGNPRTLMNSFIQGTSVFTFTVFDVPRLIKDFFAQTETTPDQYDCFAFHQANLYILKQIAKKAKIDFERMPITLDRYGNTSGASAIVSLCDKYGNDNENKRIKVLTSGFGIGISLGAVSFEIDTNDILPIFEDDAIFEEGLITDPNQLYEKK